MNVVPLDPVLPEDLRRRLAALPDFAPPPTLRERVAERTWNAPPRRRAWPAVAATLAAIGVGAALLPRAPAPAGGEAPLARMALLERDVQALRVGLPATSAAVATLEGELARIDRAIAASYAAGAPEAAREVLWRDREAVLDGLLQAYRRPDRMIRI